MKINATFIIPTLNAKKHLVRCLASIVVQDYNKDAFEVFVIDGDSTDGTLEIAEKFRSKLNLSVLRNKQVDAESGKRLGIQKANGDVVILLDADNVIVGKNWLKNGLEVFENHPEVWGVESNWLVNPQDSLVNQYFAMLKIADPVARVFSPSYRKFIKEYYPDYSVISVDTNATPIIGANGFFYKKELVDTEITKTKKFEEVNYVAELISQGHQEYALLKNCGIYHDYCHTLWAYAKKRRKIANKFLTRKSIKQKTWADKVGYTKFVLATLYNASFIGPLVEAIYQIYKTKNIAWVFHPFVSLMTVIIYGYYLVVFKVRKLV